ncbi:ROK family protein [Paenibacillus pasadenensis]|uniref:Putative sugar kinase n=1 Tax=Paenibacillus pasadenensis TaxID=217090 RepID=A0A2N5N1Z6_9BACL|nr:ROK family protein [Paenibacillus pasadenensis]PLT44349.1 putative sugar kinase [Paenibacillus pasadenensis]
MSREKEAVGPAGGGIAREGSAEGRRETGVAREGSADERRRIGIAGEGPADGRRRAGSAVDERRRIGIAVDGPVDERRRAGVVREGPADGRQPGVARDKPVLGIDIGGTGIKGAVLSPSGRLLAQASLPTEAARGREAVLRTAEALVLELLERCPDAAALGIASAGRIDAERGAVVYATANLPGWTGLRLADWAERSFGLPACADNDANAALLGEARLGAARGLSDAVLLTLGTGVGGANLVGGRIVRGAGWSGGEWGHAVLVPGGRPCNCGRRGCAETYLSGSALMHGAARRLGRPGLSPAELERLLFERDGAAQDAMREYAARLALFLANLQAGLDPAAVVLGGGGAESLAAWRPLLDEALAAEGAARLTVVPAQLGPLAGCIGAALMAAERLDGGLARSGADEGGIDSSNEAGLEPGITKEESS